MTVKEWRNDWNELESDDCEETTPAPPEEPGKIIAVMQIANIP